MFKTKNEMTALHRANVRGGNGAPEFRYLFSPEEMGGRYNARAGRVGRHASA